MTYKVGPKGQVVLPKRIRDELGIRPGDEVEVSQRDDRIEIRRVQRPGRLLGMLAHLSGRGTEALLRERRDDLEREERKLRGSAS